MALEWLVKSTMLLGITLAAGHALRRAPARVRHGLWTVSFVALLLLPLLSSVLPVLPVPIAALARPVPQLAMGTVELHGVDGATRTTASAGTADGAAPPSSINPVEATAAAGGLGRLPTAATLLAALWILGVLAALTSLLAAHARARLLIRDAQPLECDRWGVTAARICRRLGLRRHVPLLISDAVTTPMAGGLFRRVILLPPTARAWGRSRRSMVLAHELVHLRRLDPFRHAIVRLGMAAYWFHPLAWIAARHAAVDREQACDETVLAMGARPSTYARQLLELAEALACPAMPAVAALPIIEPSLLERRLMAILDHSPRPVSRLLALGSAGLVAVLTLSIAAAQPVAPQAGPTAVLVSITPVVTVAATAAIPPMMAAGLPQDDAIDRDSACWWDLAGSSFSGSMSASDDDSGMVIREQVGTRNGDRVIQKTFGDTRLCLLAQGDVEFSDAGTLETVGTGGTVLLESRRHDHVQRLRLGAGGEATWWVDGVQKSYDAAARSWREGVLAVLGSTWQVSQLRGEVSGLRGEASSIRGQASSLRGEMSSARGQVSSLRGEVSSARGQVSSMKGEISSARGQASSLRGEISSIRGHESSLRGAIASERGAISSLRAARGAASDSTRSALDAEVAKHEARIIEIEAELRDYGGDARVAEVEVRLAQYDVEAQAAAIQARIDDYDLAARIADLEQQIADYDLEGRTRDLEAQLAALDVEGKVAAIEASIMALDADRRIEEIQGRLRLQLDSLERVIDSIH